MFFKKNKKSVATRPFDAINPSISETLMTEELNLLDLDEIEKSRELTDFCTFASGGTAELNSAIVAEDGPSSIPKHIEKESEQSETLWKLKLKWILNRKRKKKRKITTSKVSTFSALRNFENVNTIKVSQQQDFVYGGFASQNKFHHDAIQDSNLILPKIPGIVSLSALTDEAYEPPAITSAPLYPKNMRGKPIFLS